MINVNDITGIMVSLEVDKRIVLYILIAPDGIIKRLGDGRADCKETQAFIGRVEPGIFKELKAAYTQEMANSLNQYYEIHEIKGQLCDLKVMVDVNGVEGYTQFVYGTASVGPSRDFADFAARAVSLTNPWYAEQHRIMAEEKAAKAAKEVNVEKKSWWKPW
ncbi:hypothetical protein [Chitinophaga agri]|uniref:Uncharacterized protein n=1 Tax=Chitinophaga agri TaxID=2703787 RepID=A0A6B9ZLX9_9BACT|nr:hypothetical protein [Chitinophaga agri]QHS63388.1 hypothetical protein GWR21_28515 [Chitinophaga agri]